MNDKCLVMQRKDANYLFKYLIPRDIPRVDLFSTYGYSYRICHKKVQVGKCNSLTRMLQMNPLKI